MSLEVLFGAVYALAAVVSLWSLTQLNGFLSATDEIADGASLERFKALARVQMYLALAMMVLLGGGMLVGLVLITRHGLSGLMAVVLVNMVILGLGVYHKKVEVRTRGLAAASDALAREYAQVSQTWTKKALPDF